MPALIRKAEEEEAKFGACLRSVNTRKLQL